MSVTTTTVSQPMVHISSPSYPGADFFVGLNGDIPRCSGGTAKYTTISRPTLRDALEFDSEDPLKLTFGVLFDAFPDGSVEDLIGRLYGLAARSSLPEPPVINISGPLPYTQLNYKITQITDDGLVERRPDGIRCRQELKLELTEVVDEDVVAVNTPAAAAVSASNSSTTSSAPASGGTWVVKKGDTLWAIAQAKLGSGTRWQEIASLNGISDPRKLQIGVTLQLPAA